VISYCLVQRCLGRCRNIWLTRSAVIQLSYKKSHAPRVTRHRHTNKSHVKVTCLRSFTTAGSTLAALAPCRHPPPPRIQWPPRSLNAPAPPTYPRSLALDIPARASPSPVPCVSTAARALPSAPRAGGAPAPPCVVPLPPSTPPH
jgi:hypothetical protein